MRSKIRGLRAPRASPRVESEEMEGVGAGELRHACGHRQFTFTPELICRVLCRARSSKVSSHHSPARIGKVWKANKIQVIVWPAVSEISKEVCCPSLAPRVHMAKRIWAKGVA
jgi:hypothetical protein